MSRDSNLPPLSSTRHSSGLSKSAVVILCRGLCGFRIFLISIVTLSAETLDSEALLSSPERGGVRGI